MRWKAMIGLLVGVAAMCMPAAAGDRDCVEPWDNGGYDERGAQQSQVGYGLDWKQFGHISFDDFYLCEGQIYSIQTIRGIICTNAAIPKAHVAIFEDCDGLPVFEGGRGAIAEADSVAINTTGAPRGYDCTVGTVEIHETGLINADGLRILEVTATFPKLWLRGGTYWLSIWGYSGNANPLDEFYWGFAGQGVVKGKPGLFYNSHDETITDTSGLCCGCTDFAFSIEGKHCEFLYDNAEPYLRVAQGGNGNGAFPFGSPSLQNGTRTTDKSRSADDILFPPDCIGFHLICYIEAYIWTNCDRVALQVYDSDCHCPHNAAFAFPPEGLPADCVTDTGHRYTHNGIELRLLKAQFYSSPFAVLGSGNLWYSVYGLGDNRQNARAYFAWADRCDRACDIFFNTGCTRGPAFEQSIWQKGSRDFAIALAVEELDFTAAAPACPADFNQRDGVTMQDLFDFLVAWFAGCP